MSDNVTFSFGDVVVCSDNYAIEEHFKPGHEYIVSESLEHHDTKLVGFFGIDDLLFNSGRFSLAIPTQPAAPPSPVAKRDVFAYLATEIEVYANDPPEDAYDAGYAECLKDVMEDVFGVVPVATVSFVVKGSVNA
jgi:hypothetical protein